MDEGSCSLALFGGGAVLKTAQGRGIAPLLGLFDEAPALFVHAAAADKIIGKAAAMIFVQAGVVAVYGKLMSEAGRDYLLAHGVRVAYGETASRILNRAGDGLCPIETSVLEETDPAAGIACIRARLAQLSAGAPRN